MRVVFAATLVALGAAPAAAAPAPITGRWLVTDGTAIVDVAPCGAALCGRMARIVKARVNGPTTDIHNPDPAQRTHPVLGITILSGLVPVGDRWQGRVYDPDSGRSYRSELTRDGGTLHVKGCLGLFCRTLDWTQAG